MRDYIKKSSDYVKVKYRDPIVRAYVAGFVVGALVAAVM